MPFASIAMVETNATILIPDISGFTEFMTTTELNHASRIINWLIDTIVKAVDEQYDVSEIEGDAVLLIKKGPAPSNKEILDICLKIFSAFHNERQWMEQHSVCPCGACRAVGDLTLKFIAHHGPLAEIKVGHFVKQAGTEMIVAHRLLKNSIDNKEYLLLTEKLLQQEPDFAEGAGVEWISAWDEYAAIGKVPYRFTLLGGARTLVQEPPAPQQDYRRDDTPFRHLMIGANYKRVYMRLVDIPARNQWVPGLLSVEQDTPDFYVGSIHYCTFEGYEAILSPLRMSLSAEEIIYAESCHLKETNQLLVYEFVFRKVDENTCRFSYRLMNGDTIALPAKMHDILQEGLQQLAGTLKEKSEGVEQE